MNHNNNTQHPTIKHTFHIAIKCIHILHQQQQQQQQMKTQVNSHFNRHEHRSIADFNIFQSQITSFQQVHNVGLQLVPYNPKQFLINPTYKFPKFLRTTEIENPKPNRKIRIQSQRTSDSSLTYTRLFSIHPSLCSYCTKKTKKSKKNNPSKYRTNR